jgi:hypothetical protein
MDKENKIVCAACDRLENRLAHFIKRSTVHERILCSVGLGAKENLAKHREICEIYKGENK